MLGNLDILEELEILDKKVMTNKINISVFGASSRDVGESYIEAAHELGKLIAKKDWVCINGAGCEGLMRAVSDGALEAGGSVTGVIPKFMVDNGWHYEKLTRIITTADMHERKLVMAKLSQAIVALPGGCGTMEELLEAMTWRQLNLAPKPIIVLNTLGYYNPLVEMINNAITQGFMKKSHHRLWTIVNTPHEAIEAIEKALGQKPEDIESKY